MLPVGGVFGPLLDALCGVVDSMEVDTVFREVCLGHICELLRNDQVILW